MATRHQGGDRIGQRRGDRQQRSQAEGIGERPHDDEDTGETDDRRRQRRTPTFSPRNGPASAVTNSGTVNHKRHDVGERHGRECEIIGGVGHHQDQAAHDQQSMRFERRLSILPSSVM
jgi:hypothetical protein